MQGLSLTSDFIKNVEILRNRAATSIRTNIITIDGRQYLSAGAHHFRTLWTRDFCYSVKGLLAIGESRVVRDHLEMLFSMSRPDGLVPRVADSMPILLRVVLACAARALPILPSRLPMNGPLRPEFLDEHGTAASDSNVLVILAALDYFENTQDRTWLLKQAPVLRRAFDYYQKLRGPNGDQLISQPPFSDWQDSVKREGQSFYNNLLYLLAHERMLRLGVFDSPRIDAEKFQSLIVETFWSEKDRLFRSLKGLEYFSLDAHLFLLERDNQKELSRFRWPFQYADLKASKFFNDIPGFNTFPSYPANWRSLAVKLSRLGDYHGGIHWTWLMALSAKVSLENEDQATAEKLLNQMIKSSDDGHIYEILDSKKDFKPWSSWVYLSEFPFSWGSGKTLEFCGRVSSGNHETKI